MASAGTQDLTPSPVNGAPGSVPSQTQCSTSGLQGSSMTPFQQPACSSSSVNSSQAPRAYFAGPEVSSNGVPSWYPISGASHHCDSYNFLNSISLAGFEK